VAAGTAAVLAPIEVSDEGVAMAGSQTAVLLQQHREVVTLRLQGDFDLATAAQLRSTLLSAYQLQPAELIVSVHEVGFLDALTVGILAAARTKFGTRGCPLTIAGSTPTQARVLELGGLTPQRERIRIPRPRAALQT